MLGLGAGGHRLVAILTFDRVSGTLSTLLSFCSFFDGGVVGASRVHAKKQLKIWRKEESHGPKAFEQERTQRKESNL